MVKKEKILGFLAVGLILAVFGLAQLDRYCAERYLRPGNSVEGQSDSDANLNRKFEMYMADLKDLKSKNLLPQRRNQADAGPYLNAIISWDYDQKYEPSKKAVERFLKQSGKNPISLDSEVKKKIHTSWENWKNLSATDVAHIDTAWIHEARKFDHWNIDKNSPLDYLPKYDFIRSPIPATPSDFALIHMLKTKNGAVASKVEAVKDVLHFANLLFSQELLLSELDALTALGMVQVFIDSEKLWPQFEDKRLLIESRQRMRAVFWATAGLVRPTLNSNIAKIRLVSEAAGYGGGLCASIREGFALGWWEWTLEQDGVPDKLAEYREFITKNNKIDCNLTWLREKTPPWEKAPYETAWPYLTGQGIEIRQDTPRLLSLINPIMQFMPRSRKALGQRFVLMASYNTYRHYYPHAITEDKKEKSH